MFDTARAKIELTAALNRLRIYTRAMEAAAVNPAQVSPLERKQIKQTANKFSAEAGMFAAEARKVFIALK